MTYQAKANKHCWTGWVCYNWGCATYPIASYGHQYSVTADPWTVDTSTAQQLTITVTRQGLADHPGCLFDDLFYIKIRARGSHSWADHAIFLESGESSGSTVIPNLTSNQEYILRMYCYADNAQEKYYMGRSIATVS